MYAFANLEITSTDIFNSFQSAINPYYVNARRLETINTDSNNIIIYCITLTTK